MDYLKRPCFHAKRGLFAYEDTARNVDEFARFYEVRFLPLLPDYTKWCAGILPWNNKLFSDCGEITDIMTTSKLSEKTKVGY